jgi:two-component system, OmpR family, response regulator
MRVLLVEDDQKAARVLRQGLQEEGFTVDVAHAGDEGEYKAEINDYDVIVLDWLLPGKAGIDVCRDLRARGLATPIVMLTAKDAVIDRVTGLNTGADDYLTKPFAFVELLARIRALLRRGDAARTPILEIGDLVLDPVSHRVTRGDRRVVLTPKEYALLEYLMRHAGRVVTRTELGEHVWQEEHDTLTNLVDVHMSHLRRKVDGGATTPLIHTVRGRGYRLGAEPG